jgi:hypothetical protein
MRFLKRAIRDVKPSKEVREIKLSYEWEKVCGKQLSVRKSQNLDKAKDTGKKQVAWPIHQEQVSEMPGKPKGRKFQKI